MGFLAFQYSGTVFAGNPPPVWSVPVYQTSHDGHAWLAWNMANGDKPVLFKITETFGEEVKIHYTESTGLRARRVEPGEYQFVLQSCDKNDINAPDCGVASSGLTLVVTQAVTSSLLSQPGIEDTPELAADTRNDGPDQLLPGHWFNPEKDGHGWSFYWSNRLALPQNDPLFGNNYDLVGIWYTHEAKLFGVAPGCSSCPPVASAYRPVVLKLKAVSIGSDSYAGGLYVSRGDGSELWLGSADVTFGSNNTNAMVNWSANFKKESLSDSDPLVFLLGSDPTSTNNISHFSGIWQRSGDNGFEVVSNIGDIAEVITVMFHDDSGDPTWIQAINSGSAVSGSSNFCLSYLSEGYSPREAAPLGWQQNWYLSGCDPSQSLSASNRNGRRAFSDLDEQNLWADFTLPGTDFASGSITIGSSNSTVSLEKAASFHGVFFNHEGGSSCQISGSSPTCPLQLTWYTDGDYPNATVYAHNISTNTFDKVLTSSQAAMVDIPYAVSGEGLYEFELRMGDDQDATLMARSEVFTVTGVSAEPQPETPPDPAPQPSMTASNSSSRVGATAGSFSVTESGSAAYSIPILTAPASGGVGPQISLNYDSQSANGEVGVGWSIGGVSAITLCPQTMEQDGVSGSRGIRLDGSDRFCLDGQRLVVDPASGEYGGDGTQYRTEIDIFARITSHGSAGNGPAWFKVEHKNGTVVEYGNSADSRIEARGSAYPATVFTWAQNRFQDRSGNYMLYSYLENNAGPVSFVIQAIDYTGNIRAGTGPSARLSFAYRDRSADEDLVYQYFAGVEVEQRHLLLSIRSQGRVNPGSPLEDLRFYELGYEEDGVGRNILTSLTECRSVTRTTCYQPTRFDWLKSESKIDSQVTVLNGLLPKSNLSGMLLADVSGDGRPDLLYTKLSKRNYFLHVKEATAGAGFSEWATAYKMPKKADGSPPQVFAIDLNSDGFQDLVYSKYSKKTGDYSWVTLISSGNGFSAETELNSSHRFFLTGHALESRFQIMDFNGDGLSDILHAHTDGSGQNWKLTVLLNVSRSGGRPAMSAPIELDVDNTDLFPFDASGEWDIDMQPPLFGWSSISAEENEIPDARMFDFNGDGAVDLLLKVWRNYQKCISNCPPRSNATGVEAQAGRNIDPVYEHQYASFWVLMESNGQNAFTRHSVVAMGNGCTVSEICLDPEHTGLPRSDYVWPVDINADGLADLAWGDLNRNWHFRINTGNGFGAATLIDQVPDGTNELVRFEDWNGDTYPDLVYPSGILDTNAKWMVNQNHFGQAFAAVINTQVLAGNVGGNPNSDPVENDGSVFADFDGDGKKDQLLINRDKNAEILSASIRKGMNVSGERGVEAANVITSITNGFGAKTEIIYKPLTDRSVYTRMRDSASVNWGRGAAVYDFIAPFYVVSEVSGNAPTFNNPGARSLAEYHYIGGKLQAGGRGLLGFAEIIAYDPQLQIRSNTRFRQDFPFTGLPVDITRTIRSAGSKFRPITIISANEPTSWPVVNSGTGLPATATGAVMSYELKNWNAVQVSSGAWQLFLNASLQRNYTLSGGLESKVMTQNSFDTHSNLEKTVVSSYTTDGSGPFSRRTTDNQWSGISILHWNLGNLASSQVAHSRSGETAVIRKSGFEYDSTTALIMKEIIEPGDPVLEIATSYSYDKFGNRKSTSKQGFGTGVRSSRVAYDALGRFVISETDALGQVFRKIKLNQWDVFGNPLEIENIDGVVSISAIDRMGRPFASYNQTGAWQKTLNYPGKPVFCPDATVWYSKTTLGGGAINHQCFDINGRKIRSVSKSINNKMVFVDQYHDITGRPERVSEPYFENDSPYWNSTEYDVAGRVTHLQGPGNNDLRTYYDEQATNSCTSAGPGVTVTTNALGQRTVEVKNVLGETEESFDANCGRVSFDYDSMGYLNRVTGVDGSSIRMSYDGAGRKVSQSDPDKGSWQYAYNAFGELTRQLDSKRQAIDFEYDALGRVTNRRELSGVDSLGDSGFVVVNLETTNYRTVSPGKSQAATVIYRSGDSGAISHQVDNSYDWLGRLVRVSSTVNNQQFYQETTYDAYGRVFQQFDVSGDSRGLRYAYKYGHLIQLKEAREGGEGLVYQSILNKDARGNVTVAELGNGVTTVAGYDPGNGHLTNLSAYDPYGVELQNVDYLFDVLGNLNSRHDQSAGSDLKESFSYDRMNRLTQVKLLAPSIGIASPIETLAMDYDATGNISWKSDVGVYVYGNGTGSGGPHAVIQAGNTSYGYDANGNQVSGDDRSIAYSIFDKAVSLTKGDQVTRFAYGVGHHRILREDIKADSIKTTTLYLGNVEYISKADGNAFFKRYLGGVAISNFYPVTSRNQLSFLLKDHIGSIHSVLDESGQITQRMHFSPFGERRDVNWQTPLDDFLYTLLNDVTSRGFTGHEHIDSMGIIHMNGRIYDAKLGRFLQADTFVQAPKNSQSLNRYSYVFNNPLSYTDPSGHFSLGKFLKKWGPTILAIAASVVLPGSGGILMVHFGVNNAFAQFVITGFIAGGITGGVRGAVKGAFIAAVTYGVTEAFNQVPGGKVQLNEANITPSRDDLTHMLGTGDPGSGLYRIEVGQFGDFEKATSITSNSVQSGETIFTNGLKNNFQNAVRNGTTQVAQLDGAAYGYILNYNPTKTVVADAIESVGDITSTYFGVGQTELAGNLAKVIDSASRNGITGLRLIGHSQGAAITTSALRFAADTGLDLSSVGSVSLHGAPINDIYVKNSLARRTGINTQQISTRAQFGDPVHNLLGANFISNPLSLPFSAIRIPHLFSSDATLSPHTVPCFGGRTALC